MSIRAILMDIDGTLTNDEKKITPRTKAALAKAQDMGIRLILASGRPTNGLLSYARELDMPAHHGLLVSFNGSMVTDCATGETLYKQELTLEEGREILTHLKNFPQLKPVIYQDRYMYVQDVFDCMIQYKGQPFNIYKYESRCCELKVCEVGDLVEFASFPMPKILTAASPEYLQENYRAIRDPFLNRFSCMFTADFYFEFTPNGVDKARALSAALPALGLKREELIAFGDGQNDVSMIRYAGVGVAMENAVDELKQAADEITLNNNADGIAASLARHIPGLNV